MEGLDVDRSGGRRDACEVGSPAWLEQAAALLRRALVARNGLLDGSDAAATAVAWAWEHRERLAELRNPLGYLYRVGQSSLRRQRLRAQYRAALVPRPLVEELPGLDIDLFRALQRLTDDQRMAVVLVHMYGFSYREVAELLEVRETAVTNYVHRGLARLRRILSVDDDQPERSR